MQRKGDKTNDVLLKETIREYKTTREKIVKDIIHLLTSYNQGKLNDSDVKILLGFIKNKRHKLFKIIYTLYTKYGISRELKIPVFAVYKGYKHRRFNIHSDVFIIESDAEKLRDVMMNNRDIQELKDGVIYKVQRILTPLIDVTELDNLRTKYGYEWDA